LKKIKLKLQNLQFWYFENFQNQKNLQFEVFDTSKFQRTGGFHERTDDLGHVL
jgi:hypothetical protein